MSWKKNLTQRISQHSDIGSRLAIIGVGNELNGDDAAGIQVIRSLGEKLEESPDLLLVEGGQAPENHTGAIRKFRPELVLIVDAAEAGKIPGEIFWVKPTDIDGLSASTHSLPLSMLASFLTTDLDCKVAVLGIQIELVDTCAGLSEPVREAVNQIVDEILSGLMS